MKDILLIGASGHCKACIDVIEKTQGWRIVGLVDRKDCAVDNVLGYPVIGSDEDLPKLKEKFDYAFICVGQIESAQQRTRLFDLLKDLKFQIPVLISPLAYVSKHSVVEEGTIIMHHAVVGPAVTIGKNCIINTKALIEHDAIVGDHCHIATAAVINGGVEVGDLTFVGSNCSTKQYVKIPERSFIKAGTVFK